MSGLFGGGQKVKTPAAPVPEPPPAVEDASVKQREAEDLARRRRGSAALNRTGRAGTGAPATAGAKALLGE